MEYSAKDGYPQDKDDVVEMIKASIDSLNWPNPFIDGRPRKSWMIAFVCRNKESLGPCKPELLTKTRSEDLSEDVVTMLYSLLERKL